MGKEMDFLANKDITKFEDYTRENAEYQAVLNRYYKHKNVIPLEKYINENATLLHYCFLCEQSYYAKPKFISNDGQRHNCNSRYDTTKTKNKSSNPTKGKSNKTKPKKSKVKDKSNKGNLIQEKLRKESLEAIRLYQFGYSPSAIAQRLNIPLPMVNEYLKRREANYL